MPRNGRSRFSRRSARRPRYSRFSRARRSTSKKVFEKMVKKVASRVVRRSQEVKSNNYTLTMSAGTLQPTTPSLVGNLLVVSPTQSTYGWTIAQGVQDNQRIGNQISIRKLIHRYVINLTGYNATTNTQPRPVYVRLYYFKSKWQQNQDLALGNVCGANANFFQNQATDYGFTGSLFDLTRKMQSENYTYLTHRTYKLGTAIQQNGGTTTTANYVATNNDFKLSVIAKVNLARFYKSKYTFNDANQVMTPWCFCLVQVLDAGNTVLGTTQSLIQMNSTMECEYTDA